MNSGKLILSAVLFLTACTPYADKDHYFAAIQLYNNDGEMYGKSTGTDDLRIDACFKTDEKAEPQCFHNLKNRNMLRFKPAGSKLALYSITLLDEKPYGDKNYYYSWQAKDLKWLSIEGLNGPVYIGALLISFGSRKGEEYPKLSLATYCDPKVVKMIEAKENAPVLQQCLQIGSITTSGKEYGRAVTVNMPPKPLYRPFGRDPDVPFGEIPPNTPKYHD